MSPPQPRTEKQHEAARRNGAKSRGPVTPEGKAISARNSYRHGRYSKDGSPEMNALVAELHDILNEEPAPVTPHPNAGATEVEACLTAQLSWMQRQRCRLDGFESNLYNNEVHRQRKLAANEPRNIMLLHYRGFDRLVRETGIIDLILRLGTVFHRQRCQALASLGRFQKSVANEPATGQLPTEFHGNGPGNAQFFPLVKPFQFQKNAANEPGNMPFSPLSFSRFGHRFRASEWFFRPPLTSQAQTGLI